MKNFKNIEEFIIDEEVKLFVGEKKFEYYKKKWLASFKGDLNRNINKPKSAHTFNLAAFLILPVWMGYRKLDLYFWVFTFLICAVLATEIMSGFYIPTVAYTSGSLMLSLMANYFYLVNVKDKIEKIPSHLPQDRRDIISSIGETSLLRAFLYGVIYIALIFGTVFLSI